MSSLQHGLPLHAMVVLSNKSEVHMLRDTQCARQTLKRDFATTTSNPMWHTLQWHPDHRFDENKQASTTTVMNGTGGKLDHEGNKRDSDGLFERLKKLPMHPDGVPTVRGTCVRDGEGRRLSVQQTYEPSGKSFGSGMLNDFGLKIQSYRIPMNVKDSIMTENEEEPSATQKKTYLESRFTISGNHNGFPGLACGGIVGTAMETQGNWNAAIKIMDDESMDVPPLTVTASYTIKINRPTPVEEPLLLLSRIVNRDGNIVKVEMALAHDDDESSLLTSHEADLLFESDALYAVGHGDFHWIYPRERWSAAMTM